MACCCEQISCLAQRHDHRLEVDVIRAYHFGARCMYLFISTTDSTVISVNDHFHLSCSLNTLVFVDNVEIEIVLPWDMTVLESHDIALALQHKIEDMEDVERAFVHVSSSSIHIIISSFIDCLSVFYCYLNHFKLLAFLLLVDDVIVFAVVLLLLLLLLVHDKG